MTWGSNNSTWMNIDQEVEVEFRAAGETPEDVGLVDWIKAYVDIMEELQKEFEDIRDDRRGESSDEEEEEWRGYEEEEEWWGYEEE